MPRRSPARWIFCFHKADPLIDREPMGKAPYGGLTRYPNVEDITVVHFDEEMDMSGADLYPFDNGRVIWSRGQPALGTPGDELYKLTHLIEDWSE